MASKGGMASGVEVARINVKVGPDTREFRRKLQSELDEIERTLKGDIHIKAHLDSAQAKADFERLKASMNRDRIKLGVDLDVDKSKKNDLLGSSKKSAFADMGLPSFGSGINPAGWAVILTAITAAAAPLVGIVSTGIAALPGLLTTVMAPIAAVTLGLDGITKAATNAGLFGDSNGKKKGGGETGAALDEIKQKVSDTFETGLTPAFEKIGSVFRNSVFQDGFVGIASGVSKMADGFANAVSQGPGLQSINNSLANIGNGLGLMAPGIQSMNTGIAGMVEQFTAGMPGIASWFNQAMAGFDQWVAKVSADGSLQSAFSNLGTILDKIAGTVADLAQQGIEFLSDPENIQMTIDMLDAVKSTLSTIMSISSAIADVWGKVFHGDALDNPSAATKTRGSGRVLPSAKGFQDDGTKAQVDEIHKSITETGDAAVANKAKVDDFIGGGGSFDTTGATTSAQGVKPPTEQAPVPDLAPAKAAITDYQTFVAGVTQQVKDSLTQATSSEALPAPNFDNFKAAWNQLPAFVAQAMGQAAAAAGQGVAGIVNALSGGTGAIMAIVGSWTPAIQASLSAMYPVGNAAGLQLAAGMAAGITAGSSNVIAAAAAMAAGAIAAAKSALDIQSPSREFMKIGDFSAKGFAVGLDNGFQPVLDQAKELAGKVADSFANGSDPTAGIAGYPDTDIKRIKKVLDLETKRLEMQAKAFDYQSKTSGNTALKGRADEIRMQKDQIALQKDMLGLTSDYNDEAKGSGEDPFVKAASGLMNAPVDFAKATGKQFLSDLGIKGDGMISNAITEGIQYIFNVGSMDDAFAAKERQERISAMSVIGPGR